MARLRRCMLVVSLLAADLEVLPAATRTWTGNSVNVNGVSHDNLWTNPSNWAGNNPPQAGDDLIFNGGIQVSSFNSFPNLTIHSLTVTGHVITGLPVALDVGITSGGGQINLDGIKLNFPQTFVSTTPQNALLIGSPINNNGQKLFLSGDGNFTLTGVISGSGGIRMAASGTATLTAANTYTGVTEMFGTMGFLQIFGSQPQSFVEVVSGEFGGAGTVGGVALEASPSVLAPGAIHHGTGILTVSGYLQFFKDTGPFAIDVNGTTPGSGYDQVKVVNNGDVGFFQGNELSVTLGGGFTPDPGDSFVIIDNDGTDAVLGTFANLPEGASFTVPNPSGGNTKFFITYRGGDGNDVVLHVATARFWKGGGVDNKWRTAGNWSSGIAPEVGDRLQFQNLAAQKNTENDFPAGTTFTSIIFNDDGYVISGNEVRLITELAAVYSSNSGQGIAVNLVISGPAQVRQESLGSGPLVLNAANTYTGGSLIRNGTLTISGSQPDIPVTIERGTLNGIGSIGPVNVSANSPAADSFVSPGSFSPIGLLTTKDVILNVTAQLLIDFGPGTAPGSGYDQLDVHGAVTLGNASLALRRSTNAMPPVGTSLIIVKNDGTDPVNGTFLNLPEGTAIDNPGAQTPDVTGGQVVITYHGGDGNDVALQVTASTSPEPMPSPLLGNISTRLRVESGDNALIGGFIVTGTQPKRVIVRAIGPSLAQFFSDTLGNPTLDLFQGNTLLASNNDWKDTQQAEIQATMIAPSHDLESAIVITLPADNTGYTAVVRGANQGTGVGVVEIYDLDSSVDSKLANISTRGFVQIDPNVLIAGTIVTGSGAQKVIIRAIAPSLSIPGILPDPTLELHDQNGGLLESNDNWVDSANKQAIVDSGVAPPHDKESAIVADLPAANASYTAIVRGVNSATGIAVVEVYALD